MELKIQKTDKIIIIFYIFLAISFTIGISYITSTFDTTEHLIEFPQPVTELQITKIVDVNQEEAFLIMTDVKNYPKILPRNIISVNIINQIDNSILAEYEVIEHGIRSKLLVSHTMYPYDKHTVEVMDGDAKGTKLIQDFTVINTPVGDIGGITNLFLQGLSQTEIAKLSECNSPFDECTRIDSQVELNLEGLLSPFSYLPKRNLDHASNTVITSFTNYMEIKTKNEKIIDDLYREILLRPADTGAFEYWGSLLESEKITKLELRKSILKSEEALSLKKPEARITEYVYSIFHEVYELNGPYREEIPADFRVGVGNVGEPYDAFDPRIDQDEFKKMVIENEYRLKIEEITLDELRLELEQLKENGIDFFVDDLESVNEQFLDWKKRFVDKTHDFCYTCKWKNLAGSGS